MYHLPHMFACMQMYTCNVWPCSVNIRLKFHIQQKVPSSIVIKFIPVWKIDISVSLGNIIPNRTYIQNMQWKGGFMWFNTRKCLVVEADTITTIDWKSCCQLVSHPVADFCHQKFKVFAYNLLQLKKWRTIALVIILTWLFVGWKDQFVVTWLIVFQFLTGLRFKCGFSESQEALHHFGDTLPALCSLCDDDNLQIHFADLERQNGWLYSLTGQLLLRITYHWEICLCFLKLLCVELSGSPYTALYRNKMMT